MIDVISFVIGVTFILVVLLLRYVLMDKSIPTIVIEAPPVDKVPYCPDCQSYDLMLIDNCDGVPWLKGHVTETDYYMCNKCGRRFSDEEWGEAKSFSNVSGLDD